MMNWAGPPMVHERTPTVVETVEAIPLTAPLPYTMRTASDAKDSVSIVLVRLTTSDGHVGYGECFGRWTPLAYARLIDDLLAPRVVGRDPFQVGEVWSQMLRTLYGNSGGMLLEAMAGIDIAMWDLMGKIAGLPISRLLGGMSRTSVAAYGSSIMVTNDDETAETARSMLASGYRMIKLKVAGNPKDDLRRVDLVRSIVGQETEILVDANWGYDLPTALSMADAFAERGVRWLEEPLVPEDRRGYEVLGSRSSLLIAAGESEYTATALTELLAARALGVVQPDVARAGGITETRRIATVADAFHVAYAPHVGFSGAVCVAATLQLCAAMPNFLAYESMVIPNPLRESLVAVGGAPWEQLTEDGEVPVPQGPGLGIEIDESVVDQFRVRP